MMDLAMSFHKKDTAEHVMALGPYLNQIFLKCWRECFLFAGK